MGISTASSRCQSSGWRLITLGDLRLDRIVSGEVTPGGRGASKPIALLAYLSAQPRRRASRERLAELLWAGRSSELSQQSLRQALSQLRTLLGPTAIRGDSEVHLEAEIPCDRNDFLDALAADRLEESMALYGGEFIPGHVMPNARSFEEWVELERRRLQLAYVEATASLIRSVRDEQLTSHHVVLSTRARDADPLEEQGWRLLIETLLRSGQRGAAAVETASLRALADREQLNLERSTLSVMALAARQSPDVSCPPSEPNVDVSTLPEPDLVGRGRELSRLLSSWRIAQTRQVLVHIAAPPGLGKSRLLDEFAVRLRLDRVAAVRVRGLVSERDIPLTGVAQLVAELRSHRGAAGIAPEHARVLSDIVPGFVPNSDGSIAIGDRVRHRLLALRDLIIAVSAERPIAILIDDWHWIDAESRQLLSAAVAALQTSSVLVVTAARPSSTTGVAEGIDGSESLSLHPLDQDAIEALAASLAPVPDAPWFTPFIERLHATTMGSPLDLLEWLRLAITDGVLSASHNGWQLLQPQQLETLLCAGRPTEQRLARRSPAELEFLRLAATADVDLSPAELSALRVSPLTVGALERDGLIISEADGVRIAHASIAEAVLAHSSPSERQVAHQQLAGITAGSTTERGQRAHVGHAMAAGDWSALSRALPSMIERQRRRGDRRSIDVLVGEWLGSSDASQVRSVVGRLPRSVRLGVSQARMQGAALVAALVLVDIGIAMRLWPLSQATWERMQKVTIVTSSLGDRRTSPQGIVSVAPEAWPGDSAVRVSDQTGRDAFPVDAMIGQAAASPRGAARWVVPVQMPDSGVTDLFLITPDGRQHRLTSAPGDDVQPDWSPDGERVAFASSRTSRMRRTDIFVLDVDSRNVRQITTGEDWEEYPRWRSDGRMIGFLRRFDDGRAAKLCQLSLEAFAEECSVLSVRGELINYLGFLSSDVHLLNIEGRLHVHEWETATTWLVDSVRSSVLRSPDGHWLARVQDDRRLWIAPVMRPDQRRLVSTSEYGPIHPFWWPSSAPVTAPRDDRRIGPIGVRPVAGTATQLTIVDRFGTKVPEAWPVRWQVQGADSITIDASGVVRGFRAGSAIVSFTPIGGVARSDTLQIVTPSSRTLIDESWLSIDTLRWLPFGLPLPQIRQYGETFALLPNGDGVFTSGIFQRDAIAGGDGVAVEVRLSTPITGKQWQDITIAIATGVDERALSAWNRFDAFPLSGRFAPSTVCLFRYPADAEGAGYGRSFLAAETVHQANAAMRRGDWYQVRVQLFADGGCGVALDGRVVAESRQPLAARSNARVYMFGNSVGTTVRIGGVRISSGVPAGVTWGGSASR